MIKLICFTPWSTTLGSETDIILSASQVKSTVTATGCHLGPVGDEVLVAPPPRRFTLSVQMSAQCKGQRLSCHYEDRAPGFLGMCEPTLRIVGGSGHPGMNCCGSSSSQ